MTHEEREAAVAELAADLEKAMPKMRCKKDGSKYFKLSNGSWCCPACLLVAAAQARAEAFEEALEIANRYRHCGAASTQAIIVALSAKK